VALDTLPNRGLSPCVTPCVGRKVCEGADAMIEAPAYASGHVAWRGGSRRACAGEAARIQCRRTRENETMFLRLAADVP
jgi:hypothetical protein